MCVVGFGGWEQLVEKVKAKKEVRGEDCYEQFRLFF